MKKHLITTLLLCLGMLLTAVSLSPVHAGSPLRVLTYHRFDTGAWISTPMNQFKEQMNYLMDHDYQFLTIEQVYHHVRSGRTFPEKSVLIMIDDGYRSAHYNAYPFLKKHKIPVVLSIYPRAQEERYNAYIGWDTIARMARDPLIHVGNHSYSHNSLIDLKDDTDALRQEVLGARKLIEKHTGESPVAFVLPYGIYDNELIEKLRRLGGKDRLIFSTLPGIVKAGEDSLPYNRFMIDRHTGMKEFKSKLHRKKMAVKSSIKNGEHIEQVPKKIRFQFKHPDRYDTEYLHVFLNGKLISERFRKTWRGNERELTVPKEVFSTWNQMLILGLDKVERVYRMHAIAFVNGRKQNGQDPDTKSLKPASNKTSITPPE